MYPLVIEAMSNEDGELQAKLNMFRENNFNPLRYNITPSSDAEKMANLSNVNCVIYTRYSAVSQLKKCMKSISLKRLVNLIIIVL